MNRLRLAASLTVLLLALQMGLGAVARADGGDFSLDFVAAAPDSYDHSTGLGGTYDERSIGENVVESLEGGDFLCGDIVEFFTAVTVDDAAEGTQTIVINYSFDTEPTGGDTVGYDDVVFAVLNEGDSGNLNLNNNETVELTGETTTEDEVLAEVTVGGLEAGEQVIVAMGVELGCTGDPAESNGNLFAQIDSAETSEGDPINVGQQTIPLMHVNQVAPPAPVPGIDVAKSCPAKVTVGSDLTVSITITNTGEEELQDITVVDSVLGDLSDLFADTLAVGASETESVTTKPQKAQTITDTVTATATGAESATTATATDTCTSVVEAPALPPTGFSGAGGPSMIWLLGIVFGALLIGGGLRYAARRI